MNLKKDETPFGIIPRIDNQKKHIRFLKRNKYIDWVMIDINVAESILKKGKNAFSYFKRINPNIRVITTSTISDEQLLKYNVEQEIEIISKFSPEFHIPCDCPVYDDGKVTTRFDIVKNYCTELEYFSEKMKPFGVGIIPLIKAASKIEREMCYETFDKLGFKYVSYYAGQYFGGKSGNSSRKLNYDIREVVAESNIKNIMIIGSQAPSILDDFPPQVKSAAGLRWRTEVEFNINKLKLGWFSYRKSQKLFGEWKNNIESKYLNSGVNVIEMYGGTPDGR